jgi:hypothetical protein
VFIPPFRLAFRHLGFIWHLDFICCLDFVIWTWFVIWALAFELCLSFASLRHSADLHGSQKQMANRQNESCVLSGLSVPETVALHTQKSF